MKTDSAKIPTGYAPTALPFYCGMDDAGFEQFCTDLLNLHPVIHCLRDNVPITRRIVTAHRLLSGTSQKGADIRAEAEAGEVWFFQCKHTQAFGPSDVAEAVRLAEASLPHADQFVLVTTCGLSEDAQSRLGKRWLWWDGSRLTTETIRLRPREDAINLVHCYFGSDWKKALFSSHDQPLLTWQEYFEQDLSPERKHFHHRTSFTRSGDTLGQLESFAQSGAGKVTILSAAGGQGKSRLLLELARKLESQDNVPRVRFLNLNRHGLSSEQFGFLAREEDNLVLIVDDAHRLDGAVEDVARATARVKSIRLIISTRPQALEAVTKRLFDSGYAERLEKNIVLPPWKQAEIHHLAEQVLAPSVQSQATRLANLADRCPLLVVIGGELINSGAWPEAMTNEEAFRQRVFHGFKEDFLSRISESERGRVDRLIELLSFVSPTPKNEVLFDKAAE
ncbi:MAG TPA: restriction endonuclease, partial [Candidatus Limnocylindria bacterium]|nr:restriction endonuclease [Candidatus Limnocylindria bacterium]